MINTRLQESPEKLNIYVGAQGKNLLLIDYFVHSLFYFSKYLCF